MFLSRVIPTALVQAAVLQDTVVTRVINHRDLFDWTSAILNIVVLLLAAGMLVAVILLLLAIRKGVEKATMAIGKLTDETRPLITTATHIVGDARELVAMVRTDVERLTDAASAVSEQLLDAADVTSQRIDQVNAVLDVIQHEMEATAIGTVSAMHGMRVGASALTENLRSPRLAETRRDLALERARGKSFARVLADDIDDELGDEFDDDRDELRDEMRDELRVELRDEKLDNALDRTIAHGRVDEERGPA